MGDLIDAHSLLHPPQKPDVMTQDGLGILWNTTRQRHARYVVLSNNSKYPSRFWGVRTFHKLRERALDEAKSALNQAVFTPSVWYVVVDTSNGEVITGE